MYPSSAYLIAHVADFMLENFQLSYINPKNYNEAGFTNTFLALEYALAVTMEFAW